MKLYKNYKSRVVQKDDLFLGGALIGITSRENKSFILNHPLLRGSKSVMDMSEPIDFFRVNDSVLFFDFSEKTYSFGYRDTLKIPSSRISRKACYKNFYKEYTDIEFTKLLFDKTDEI